MFMFVILSLWNLFFWHGHNPHKCSSGRDWSCLACHMGLSLPWMLFLMQVAAQIGVISAARFHASNCISSQKSPEPRKLSNFNPHHGGPPTYFSSQFRENLLPPSLYKCTVWRINLHHFTHWICTVTVGQGVFTLQQQRIIFEAYPPFKKKSHQILQQQKMPRSACGLSWSKLMQFQDRRRITDAVQQFHSQLITIQQLGSTHTNRTKDLCTVGWFPRKHQGCNKLPNTKSHRILSHKDIDIIWQSYLTERYAEDLKVEKNKKCFISCIHQTYIQLAWSMSVSERSWSWEMNSRIRSRLIFALGSVSLKTLKEKCAKNVQNLKFVKLLDCWLTCGHTFKITLSFTNVSSYVTECMFFNCVPPEPVASLSWFLDAFQPFRCSGLFYNAKFYLRFGGFSPSVKSFSSHQFWWTPLSWIWLWRNHICKSFKNTNTPFPYYWRLAEVAP